MEIAIINFVIAVAVLVLSVDLNFERLNKRICNWESSYHQSLSALAISYNNDKITKDKEKKESNEINKQKDHVDSLRKRKKVLIYIRQLLPILLTIEVGHITLQVFQWSWLYEWILPIIGLNIVGLNKGFLIVIIAYIFFYFIIRTTLNDEKILKYELHNISVIAKYRFGFQ